MAGGRALRGHLRLRHRGGTPRAGQAGGGAAGAVPAAAAQAIPYTGILALHADAAEMGFLTAAIWLPSLIFALHAGAWADRFGHRRILMITADLGRAGLRWRSRSAP